MNVRASLAREKQFAWFREQARSYTEENTMCLGVPMRVIEIDGFSARCEARGIERNANLFLLQHENIQVGDLVMIHVGNAIQKMTEQEAHSAWELYDEMLALDAEARGRA
jgi:hydrogenase expression/formation protein HypC